MFVAALLVESSLLCRIRDRYAKVKEALYIRPVAFARSDNGTNTSPKLMEKQIENSEKETAETKANRCYSEYSSGGTVEFCPFKDLNLPTSYNEVVNRFRRLQGERAIEVFN